MRAQEFRIGLAGCAGDHIHADAGMRHAFLDPRHAFGIECCVITAAHALQDHIAAALQRHVEMRREAILHSEQGYGDAVNPG